jgi:hypothetical protein
MFLFGSPGLLDTSFEMLVKEVITPQLLFCAPAESVPCSTTKVYDLCFSKQQPGAVATQGVAGQCLWKMLHAHNCPASLSQTAEITGFHTWLLPLSSWFFLCCSSLENVTGPHPWFSVHGQAKCLKKFPLCFPFSYHFCFSVISSCYNFIVSI